MVFNTGLTGANLSHKSKGGGVFAWTISVDRSPRKGVLSFKETMVSITRRRLTRRTGYGRVNAGSRNSSPPRVRRRRRRVTHSVKDTSRYCDAYLTDGSGRRCTQVRGYGTDHVGYGQCKKHGGSTRNGRIAAAKQEIAAQMPVMGLPIEIDPMQGLLNCVYISAGWVKWTLERVHELRQEDWLLTAKSVKRRPLSYGKEGESKKISVREITVSNDPRLNAAIKFHTEAVERFGRFCKMALEGGVAEKEIERAEKFGPLLAVAFSFLLEGLDLSDEQRAIAPMLVEQALARLEIAS